MLRGVIGNGVFWKLRWGEFGCSVNNMEKLYSMTRKQGELLKGPAEMLGLVRHFWFYPVGSRIHP